MEDHLIKPKGRDGYVVPPPLPMKSTQEPITCANPESVAPPTDEEGKNLCETNDNDLESDYEIYRDLNHSLVGRIIKAIYDNGWYTRSISWFNNKLQKLRVAFADRTDSIS